MEANEILGAGYWDLSWWSIPIWKQYVFARPYFLYGILGIPLLYMIHYLLYNRFRVRLPFSYSAKTLPISPTAVLRIIPPLMQSTALACILIALARPQLNQTSLVQESEGIEIMLALDVSESMLLEDFLPNRLEAAKRTALSFVNGRKYDRIGIVVFAQEAIALSPLTADYDLVKQYASSINSSMVPQGGTAIGTAIGVATNRLRGSKTRSRIIVLLSDGNNTAGNIDPAIAAKLAQAFGIKIYSILIGKEGKVANGFDENGEPEYLDNAIDESTLKEIAKLGKGQYYRVIDENMLASVFQKIDKLERSAVKNLSYSQSNDLYMIYIVWSITFLAVWVITKATFMANVLED